MKKSEISLLFGLVLALTVSFFMDINTQAQSVRGRTLRLHIIADDNSRDAQRIKLEVRDTVLSVCRELLSDADSISQAIDTANRSLDFIKQAADRTLAENGADYTSRCSVEDFWFDTTDYGSFTMPRGEYTALTIRLGDAEGRNWWCVTYPSMCTGGSAKYEDDSSNTFIETENFRLKFRIVELWEDIHRLFCDSVEYDNL